MFLFPTYSMPWRSCFEIIATLTPTHKKWSSSWVWQLERVVTRGSIPLDFILRPRLHVRDKWVKFQRFLMAAYDAGDNKLLTPCPHHIFEGRFSTLTHDVVPTSGAGNDNNLWSDLIEPLTRRGPCGDKGSVWTVNTSLKKGMPGAQKWRPVCPLITSTNFSFINIHLKLTLFLPVKLWGRGVRLKWLL